jgi:membrane protein involved in colicin uptake
MADIIEVNCETGEVTTRPQTAEEIAAAEAAAAQAAADKAAADTANQAKADAKLAAQAKLQSLGLTGEQIAALFN